MAGENPYVVELIDGNPPTTRRGLAFLVCKTDPDIDAKSSFDVLDSKREKEARSRFTWWLQGRPKDNWFHGWPNDAAYRECFVFKWKEKRQHHRLYGFLCHPLTSHPLASYRRFQLCVLISHARKNSEYTDPRELDGANRLKDDGKVRKAIEKASEEMILLIDEAIRQAK